MNDIINKKKEQEDRDDNFKWNMHDSYILSAVLKGCVDELQDKDDEFIRSCLEIGADGRRVIGRNTESTSDAHGSIRMDNVFDVRIPGEREISIILNIEGQRNPKPGYPLMARATYYASRLISDQKDVYFENDHYEGLRKVYSIWVMTRPRAPYRNSVIKYRFYGSFEGNRSLKGKIPECDYIQIVQINLGKPVSTVPSEVIGVLNTIFSEGLDYQERKRRLSEEFNIPVDKYLSEGIVRAMSMNDDVMLEIENARKKAYTSGKVDSALRLMAEKNWSREEVIDFFSSDPDSETIICILDKRLKHRPVQ